MSEHKHPGRRGVRLLALLLLLANHGDIGAPYQPVLLISLASFPHHLQHSLAYKSIALFSDPVHEQVAQGVDAADDDLGGVMSKAKIPHWSTHSFHKETLFSDAVDNSDDAHVLGGGDRIWNVVSAYMNSNNLAVRIFAETTLHMR